MATLKQRMHKKNSSGSYDTVHLETSSSLVLRPSGRTVEQDLADYLPKTQASDTPPSTLKPSLVVGLSKFYCNQKEVAFKEDLEMTAKLCATMGLTFSTEAVDDANSFTEVTLPDKFIGCDYIETVTCREGSDYQSENIIFANSYCVADCASTMLIASPAELVRITMKLSADGSIFMYNDKPGFGSTYDIIILGYKFQ